MKKSELNMNPDRVHHWRRRIAYASRFGVDFPLKRVPGKAGIALTVA